MSFVSRTQLENWNGKRILGTLTQAGTAAPTASIKNKSIDTGTITWARTGTGTYTLTAAKANSFPVGTIIRGGVYDQASGKMLSGVRTSGTVITFTHGIAAGAASDVFSGVPFEIVAF